MQHVSEKIQFLKKPKFIISAIITFVMVFALIMGINVYNSKQNYAKATEAMNAGDYLAAMGFYSETSGGKFGTGYALAETLYNSETAFNRGVASMEGDHQAAIVNFKKVVEESSYYKEAQSNIILQKNVLAEEALAEAKIMYGNGSYARAYDLIVEALAENPSLEEAIALKDKYEASDLEANRQLALLTKKIAAQNEADRIARVASEERAEKALKRSEGVRLGMTQQDVLDSSWGSPEDINRTTNSYGTDEQWCYDGYNYLYFENGILTSIQN